MESSSHLKAVIRLGELLISELEMEPTDTLTRWIVFYVSDKIIKYKKSKNIKTKNALGKECYEAIMNLWEHRTNIPYGHRPLKSFEPIFNALYRLDPNNKETYFYNNSDNKEPVSQEVKNILDAINTIDKTARFFIRMHIKDALSYAIDEKTKEYIKNSIVISESILEEFKVVITFNDQSKEKSEKESLSDTIKLVKIFNKYTNAILESLKNELRDLQ